MRRKRNATQLMLVAQDCHSKRQYNNAIKILNQVIELQPKNDQAYRLLGDAFDELGQRQQAQKNYKLGIDCNPLSTICYSNYGLLLYNQGRKQQAEKIYQLCMEINPKDPTVLNNYSILLYEIKKFDKAQQISKVCLKVDPQNISCKQYLKKISQSKLKQKEKQRLQNSVLNTKNKKQSLKPNKNQEQLLQLLWERDIKIVQKQTLIEVLRDQLTRKQFQVKQMKTEIQKLRRKRNQQQNLRLCKICLNKPALFLNKKCGHLSSCKGCLSIVGKNCPICRQAGSFIRIFSSLIKQDD